MPLGAVKQATHGLCRHGNSSTINVKNSIIQWMKAISVTWPITIFEMQLRSMVFLEGADWALRFHHLQNFARGVVGDALAGLSCGPASAESWLFFFCRASAPMRTELLSLRFVDRFLSPPIT